MNLNISVSSPPVIEVSDQDIDATISIDLIIDVLEAGKVIPVTCISVIGDLDVNVFLNDLFYVSVYLIKSNYEIDNKSLMIPHKTKRGEAALARLKVYEGIPPHSARFTSLASKLVKLVKSN
ncbi:uncharacterized protein LOC131598345 [Vicia villosa]|uniref:uncharacterized protein LOC131598345 n=1 Tax=Vicia villosa TaxID=3911 RepID=UPI00273B0DC6|nr:uncharacterized protein LOC131598345 [Vicia villosa]